MIAVGAEYVNEMEEDISRKLGYQLPITPVQSVAEMLGYFGSAVDRVYFSHDRPSSLCNKCDLMAIFSVRKGR